MGSCPESEEVRRAFAVGGAEPGDGPVSQFPQRPCQVVFQVPARADGKGLARLGTVPQVIDVPVEPFAPPQVSFGALREVRPGRACVDVVAFLKEDPAQGAHIHTAAVRDLEDEQVASAVLRLLSDECPRGSTHPAMPAPGSDHHATPRQWP